jgi:hypothetical protein
MMRMSNAAARARDLLADAPESGEAERLLAHLFAEELLFLPFALLHRRVGGGRCRAIASISATASSATLMLLAPGAFITTMPRGAAGHVDVVDARAGARDDREASARR